MKKQIIIAETVAHDPKFCPTENYGPRHQCRISPKSARGLCGMFPLPEVGYETAVALNRMYGNLRVANVAGVYVLRASGAPIDQWPDVFGVTIKRKTV